MTSSIFAAEIPSDPAKLPTQAGFPDPLIMFDGSKVTTREAWETQRKPELKELFQRFMYGRYPAAKANVTAKTLFENKDAFGGKGILKEVELSMGIPDCPPIYAMVAMPKTLPEGGLPVIVGINFSGNHLMTTDPGIRIPTNWMPNNYPGVKANRATEEGRGKIPERWQLDMIVERGYALVTFYCGDVDPDDKTTRGAMRPFITPAPKGDLPGDFTASIMAWAWGAHRVVDYVVTQKEFNPKRIAVLGHSRLGKAALVAGAFDDRIAVVFPHQAGCGGTGPSRHENPKAEGVKRINTSFPHWFCNNFKAFNDDTSKIPFDQHCLLALCAPRPVLYSNATGDEWANPAGQFEMMRLANPVYQLLGVDAGKSETMPAVGELSNRRLGYWIREGKHEVNAADWKTFLDYADTWMK
jgi:hypothetical protein